MYTVVLMATLTAGSAMPEGHHCASCGHHGGCATGYCGAGYGGGYEGCGCWGGYASWSYCNMPPPNMPVPSSFGVMGGPTAPAPSTGGEDLDKPKSSKNGDKQTMAPVRGQLRVEVPASAKLFIDDRPVQTTAGVQTFDTPALEAGMDYYYMVRIEMMRDGRPTSETHRIIVRAGQVARADFNYLESESLRTVQAK